MAELGGGTSRHVLEAVVRSSGISQFRRKISGAEGAVSSFSKKVSGVSAALGGAGVAAFGAAINEARKFEEAMVEVEKVTDPQTAKQMSSAIKEMAGEIPLAQKELADLTAQAGRFGVRGTENIESFVRSTAKMATATDLNAQEAGEAFAKLATITDTPIKKVENLGSAINHLSNTMATSSSEIVQNMQGAAATLSQMGATQTEIAGLGAAMNEVFNSASKAGRGLRRVAQEMNQGRDKAGGFAKALGVTWEEFKRMRQQDPAGTIVKLAEAMDEGGKKASILRATTTSFSQKALTGLAQNTDAARSAMQRARKEFEKNTSLTDEFNSAVDTFNKQLKLFTNRLRNIAITLGEALLPGLTNLLKRLQPVLDRFESFADSLSKADIRALSVQSSIMAVTGALGVLAPAFAPVMLAIQGLSAAWLSNFADIREETQFVTHQIREQVTKTAATIRNVFGVQLTRTGSRFGQFAATIEKHVASVASFVAGHLVNRIQKAGIAIRKALRQLGAFWQAHGTTIRRHARRSYRAVQRTIQTGIQRLRELVAPALSALEQAWAEHGRAVKRAVRDTMQFVLENPRQTLRTLVSTIGGPLGTLVVAFDRNWNKIEKVVRQSMGVVRRITTQSVRAINAEVVTPLQTTDSRFRQTFGSIRQEVGQSMRVMKEVIDSTLSVVVEGIVRPGLAMMERLHRTHFRDILAETRKTMTALWNNVIKPILNTIQAAWDLWGDELTTITKVTLRGILGVIEGVLDAIATTWKATMALLRGDWRQAMTYFDNFGRRTLNGILSFVRTWGTRFSEAIGSALDDAFQAFVDWANDLIFGSLIPRTLNAIVREARSWVGDFVAPFRNAANRVTGLFNDLKSRVVGNSIVPEMLNETLDRAESWSGEFVQPFRNAVNDALNQFQKLKQRAPSLDEIVAKHGEFNAAAAVDALQAASASSRTIAKRVKRAGSPIFGDTLSRMSLGEITRRVKKARRGSRSPFIGGDRADAFNDAFSRNVNDILPGLQSGGFIEEAGLAFLHAGEQVVPAAQVDRSGGGKRFVNNGDIIINSDTDTPEQHAEDTLAELEARF